MRLAYEGGRSPLKCRRSGTPSLDQHRGRPTLGASGHSTRSSSNRSEWWKADIAAEPRKRHHAPMSEYQCWFCGEGIDRTPDAHAVMIAVENLWRWDAGSKSDDDPWQAIYAHAGCAQDRLKGATMEIEPHILGERG